MGPDPPTRYSAYFARAFAYTNTPQPKGEPDAAAKDQAAKSCESAKAGLKTLNELKKPDAMSEDDFNNQKHQPTTVFNYTVAPSSIVQTDYQTAIDAYK